MSKRERPGYAVLTLEVPTEVAEWLATYGEHLGQIAALASAKARFSSKAAKEERAWNLKSRQDELRSLGRLGYRLFRSFGGKNIATGRDLIREIASDLMVDPRTLELTIRSFKRTIEARMRDRRGREIARLYWQGFTNGEIASRWHIHPNTVSNYLRAHKAELKAYAREHPEIAKSLKGNNKGVVPGKSLGANKPVPWEAIKRAGRRV